MLESVARVEQRPSQKGPAAVDSMGDAAPKAHDTSPAAPTVDVRVVLFTVEGGRLRVALDGGPDRDHLSRGAPLPAATLDAEARRIVREATGLREAYLEQLYTFSIDDGPTSSIIVSYLALLGSQDGATMETHGNWHDVDRLPVLGFADRMVIDYALLRLRAKLGYTTIAFHLLPPAFTLSELQGTYEAILGRVLDKRNFRRRVVGAGILTATGSKRRDGSHRPALLYRFRPPHDRETFLTPGWTEDV